MELATGLVFCVLFAGPTIALARDWWTAPDAAHGMLLVPVAMWLAWRAGRAERATPEHEWGLVLLCCSVALRLIGAFAGAVFSTQWSLIFGVAALTVYYAGFRQLLHWWLPFLLAVLSIPLPWLVSRSVSLPLQTVASQWGAALLEMRHVPVKLSGNIIRLPGHDLFITEACSGLRSLTALISTAVLISAVWLRSYPTRAVLLLAAVPLAVFVNAIRVFWTGFLIFFVNPAAGDGFMHLTEGWLLFVISLCCLACIAWLLRCIEPSKPMMVG